MSTVMVNFRRHTDLPINTNVLVRLDSGENWITRTRSDPWQLASGHWVVLLEGRTGGFSLKRITKLEVPR